jgi:hypothetical protein
MPSLSPMFWESGLSSFPLLGSFRYWRFYIVIENPPDSALTIRSLSAQRAATRRLLAQRQLNCECRCSYLVARYTICLLRYLVRSISEPKRFMTNSRHSWVPTLHATDRQPGAIGTRRTGGRFHERRALVVTGENGNSGRSIQSATFYNVPNAPSDCCRARSGPPLGRAATSQNLVCPSGGSSGYDAPLHFSFRRQR